MLREREMTIRRAIMVLDIFAPGNIKNAILGKKVGTLINEGK